MDYEKGFKMKNFNVEAFLKDLDKLFNDMQDKAIAGSENVATAAWVIKNQADHIADLETVIAFKKAQAERVTNESE
jgi:hypothetical protein